MNELKISSNEVLPDIFYSVHKFFEGVNEELTSAFNISTQNGTQEFYSKLSNFLNNGFKYLKTGLGDLCVGLKTFGDKLSPLGCGSFNELGLTTSNIVIKTGEFFNFIDNLSINVNELMKQESDLEKCQKIYNTISEYLNFMSETMNDCSIYSTHLYGDAKEVLGEKFEKLSEGLLRFIQSVKLKCIIGIGTIVTAFKIFVDYLNIENSLYEIKVIENDTISYANIETLIQEILSDLEQAKAETIKIFNN